MESITTSITYRYEKNTRFYLYSRRDGQLTSEACINDFITNRNGSVKARTVYSILSTLAIENIRSQVGVKRESRIFDIRSRCINRK